MSDKEVATLQALGWELHPRYLKWWNPTSDDGARYRNTPRAYRYILEDYSHGPNLPRRR